MEESLSHIHGTAVINGDLYITPDPNYKDLANFPGNTNVPNTTPLNGDVLEE